MTTRSKCQVPNGAPALVLALLLIACGGGGGSSSAPPGTTAPPDPPSVAFITSVTGTGDLSSWPEAGGNTGLAAGDAICQARAQAAGLTGTYVAWLSDTNDDAYCRVLGLSGKKAANCGQATLPVNAGPWVRTDGFPFSGTLDQLTTDAVIYAPLRYDELGAEVVDSRFFTATRFDGVRDLFESTCTDWTSADPILVEDGSTESTGQFWTARGGALCSGWLRLACFATGAGAELPPFTTPGKRVFVTSVFGSGDLSTWPDAGVNTGLAAGDAICQARAQSAGLMGTFKAWLSDNTVNAVERLVSNGPWVRLDGVKIADDKTDLTDGRLFTAVNVDETGNYTLSNANWTGTDIFGNKSVGLMCADWQSNLPTDQGTRGSPQHADHKWTALGTNSCQFAFPLFCFED